MSGILKQILKPPFKHKKLSDESCAVDASLLESGDGVRFAVRELGSTFVTEAQQEETTSDAVRRIVHLARASRIKPKRVTFHVSSTGVTVKCATTGNVLMETDIYNITYCSADAHYNHVFAFIRTGDGDAFECHAYLCPSAKAARTLSLSIAQAFSILAQNCLKNRKNFLDDEAHNKSPTHQDVMKEDDEDTTSPPIDICLQAKSNELLASINALWSQAEKPKNSLSKSSSDSMKSEDENYSFGSPETFGRTKSTNGQPLFKKNWLTFKLGFRRPRLLNLISSTDDLVSFL